MSFGGKFDYAKEYAKYKPGIEDSKFEDYIGDDSVTWKMIDTFQKGGDMRQFDGQGNPGLTPEQQADYWIKRGATTKSAFGRAHAAEDEALQSGTYRGGTDVKPWEGNTTFEDWLVGAGAGAGAGNGDTGGWAPATGGGAPGSANYPIGLVDYQEPSAMSGIPLEFQPWLQPSHIPDSLWNYQAPTLNEWEIDRNWDWASKPASEYAPKPPVTTATTTQQHAPEGGTRDNVEQSDGWDDAYAEYGSYPGDPAGRVAKPGVGTPSVMDILSGLLD